MKGLIETEAFQGKQDIYEEMCLDLVDFCGEVELG